MSTIEDNPPATDPAPAAPDDDADDDIDDEE